MRNMPPVASRCSSRLRLMLSATVMWACSSSHLLCRFMPETSRLLPSRSAPRASSGVCWAGTAAHGASDSVARSSLAVRSMVDVLVAGPCAGNLASHWPQSGETGRRPGESPAAEVSGRLALAPPHADIPASWGERGFCSGWPVDQFLANAKLLAPKPASMPVTPGVRGDVGSS